MRTLCSVGFLGVVHACCVGCCSGADQRLHRPEDVCARDWCYAVLCCALPCCELQAHTSLDWFAPVRAPHLISPSVPSFPHCRQGLEAASGAAGLRWLEPRRVLHRPDDGLASLAAGSFSSAAVTGDGELYLWGTVLSEDASSALLKQSGEAAKIRLVI